jgi:hypothetical protein
MNTALAERAQPTTLSEAAARLIYRDRSGVPYSPVQVELVIALCQKHGLVPELGHIVLISDRAYVTNAGLLHKSHDVGDTEGILTRPAVPEERSDFLLGNDAGAIHIWRCEVWRKGQTRPYVGWGQVKPGEKGAGGSNPAEMACTRAVNRALRLAYDVGMTSLEEIAEDAPSARTVDTATGEIVQVAQQPATQQRTQPAPRQQAAPKEEPPDALIGERRQEQLRMRLTTALADNGFSGPEVGDWMAGWLNRYAVDSLAELTIEQAKALTAAAKDGVGADLPTLGEHGHGAPDDDRPF